MSQDTLFLRRAARLAIGAIALVAGCDRESPTDVAVPTVRASRAEAPGLAVSAAGKPGPAPSTYELVKGVGIDVGAGVTGVTEVLCPSGKKPLGGGFQIGGSVPGSGPDVAVYESSPRVTGGTEGWRLVAQNRTADERHFDIWVICATI